MEKKKREIIWIMIRDNLIFLFTKLAIINHRLIWGLQNLRPRKRKLRKLFPKMSACQDLEKQT